MGRADRPIPRIRLKTAELAAFLTRRLPFPKREWLLRGLFPMAYFRSHGVPDSLRQDYDGDLRIRCSLGSWIEWVVFFKGYYEPEIVRVEKSLLRGGMLAIDVGANVGVHTLVMAKSVGRNGQVIAVEPNPEMSNRLKANLALNHFTERVQIAPLALSNSIGTATLYTPDPTCANRGISSLYNHSPQLKGSIEITVLTLDRLAADHGITRLDLVKIDTDGNDSKVLLGGTSVIDEFRPAIIFESGFAEDEGVISGLSRARSMLRGFGYALFEFGFLGHLRPIEPHLPLPEGNIVCLPEGS